MNVQLLLLLALVGPFCAFTHASPTELPVDDAFTEPIADTAEATEVPKEDFTVVTGPPATEPAVSADELATETVTEAPSILVNTEEAVVETEGPAAAATTASEPLITDAPAVETEAPTEAADAEPQPVVTEAPESETNEEVVVEDDTEAGLSSGQVVGIVIGALLAMVIVIAVVIAVVRRMGKYSP
ncbi:podoplanin isoform X2 [Pempheris klunzingeri]